MHVIITDGWLARHGTVSLDHRRVALILLTFAAFVGTFTIAVYLSISRLSDTPHVNTVAASTADQGARDALAKRIGELQARMGHVDSKIRSIADNMGMFPSDFMPKNTPPAKTPQDKDSPAERLSLSELDHQNPMAGISLKIPSVAAPLAHLFRKPENPTARGGLLVNPHTLSDRDLLALVEELENNVAQQEDQLNLSHSLWIERSLNQSMPSTLPVNTESGSPFGWRIDPFTGRYALHNGLDFAAPIGTAVKASATGVVVRNEWAGGYGKVLEIEHGNNIRTRYAHLSKILVDIGDKVNKGQLVAQVGNTGRSTGPHLHFEVLVEDTPVNPARFLHHHTQQARR